MLMKYTKFHFPMYRWLSHYLRQFYWLIFGMQHGNSFSLLSFPIPFDLAVSFEFVAVKQKTSHHGCHQEEDASDESRQGRSFGARSRLRTGGTRCQHPRRKGKHSTMHHVAFATIHPLPQLYFFPKYICYNKRKKLTTVKLVNTCIAIARNLIFLYHYLYPN